MFVTLIPGASMIGWESAPAAVRLLEQAQIQVLLGGVITLILRAIGFAGLRLGGFVSRRVQTAILDGLMEDIALYRFFERNPAVVTARSIQLQLFMAVLVFVFCLSWALLVLNDFPALVDTGISVFGTLIAGFTFWLGLDLFVLVRPLAEFRAYETGVQRRIAGMKARLEKARVEQDDLAKRNRAYEEALREQTGDSEPDETPDASTDNTQWEKPAAGAGPRPQDQPDQSAKGNTDHEPPPGGQKRSSVYESAWTLGRVVRWPPGAVYGFLESDTGEQFYASAQSLAGLETPIEGSEVLFQPLPGTPHRRAALVCALTSYGQGRINSVGDTYGFVTIEDGRRADSIYFRVPSRHRAELSVGQNVGFVFGKNFIGPTAERIEPVVANYR